MLDLSAYIRSFVDEVVQTAPEFSHINQEQVVYGLAKAQNNSRYGTYAKIYPLRFENGEMHKQVGKFTYFFPRLLTGDTDLLYYVVFMIPRFLNLKYNEKIVTILHELYHISPLFNGDIRRLTNGKPAHGASKKAYDANIEQIWRRIQDQIPLEKTKIFDYDYKELIAKYGQITGQRLRIPRPKPIEG